MVAVADTEGDRVALGERVTDRVAETETLMVTDREELGVGIADSVTKAVGSDPEADADGDRVPDTLPVPEPDREGDPVALGERVADSVTDGE